MEHSNPSRDEALALVSRAANDLRRFTEQAERAATALTSALRDARAVPVEWSALAAASGLSERQMQWRVLGEAWPSVAEHNEQRREASRANPKPRPATRPGRGPGVNVKRAAEILGVARTTVYARVEAGTLDATRNELGKLRILGLEEAEDPAI
jgi:hypothetical protein